MAKKPEPQLDLFGNPILPKRLMPPAVMPIEFDGAKIRIVMRNGVPWWIAADVCRILGLGNTSLAVNGRPDREGSGLPVDQRGIANVNTPDGPQDFLCVNEPGLYALIFRSRKPDALRFQTWVCSEVLPQIRKTGRYSVTPDRIDRTQKRLKSDRRTAEVRTKNADANKHMAARTFDDGGGVRDMTNLHDAVYKGQFSGHTAATLRQALGIKGRQTPLDRMSETCLGTNLLSKILADRLVQEQATPIEDRPGIYQRVADDMSRQTLRQLGDDRRLGFRDDPKRGRILDVLDVA